MVKKTINVEVKATLQPLSRTREIDSRYPKGYKPSAKIDKDENSYWDIEKAKFHNLFLINTSQPQIQTSRKNKYYRSC